VGAARTPMSIRGVRISPDRRVVYITTDFQSFDFVSSNVVIDFQGGVLRTDDGTVFQSTTGSFSLLDPIFYNSMY